MQSSAQGEMRIRSENDIVAARKMVRDAAKQLGFGVTDVTRLVTAASELARNVFLYAGAGVARWYAVGNNENVGIELTFVDHGPGIEDVERAMQEGYSTSGGQGLGLPGTKRLVDEMELQSRVGAGTTVTVRKWRRK